MKKFSTEEVLEIIGEDEDDDEEITSWPVQIIKVSLRNQLRAEIRNRLKQEVEG